ncbi:YbfB/YjiJ family MFS transporter [Trinickia acidisoli]|uniref:YbfB/YjiJ family MFS transporter n=1 Tax=Trinickia acidisoli TaxID=2767482 RepID=UPI001F5CE12C|nr:YbfB/YjiJ family MFS transporter [Trinickia acidisoli]
MEHSDSIGDTALRRGGDAAGAGHVALACMVALAVALGVGRFAFTPLLPLMLHAGALDLRSGGLLASANYAGYFIGALTCALLPIEHARMVRVGLATTAVLTLAMGVTHSLPIWIAVRFVAGVVSAWTFVFASQWGLARLARLGAPAWGGVIYTGPGIGIVATGLMAGAAAHQGAPFGWVLFGVLCVVSTACVWRTFAPSTGQAWRSWRSGRAAPAVNPSAAARVAPASSIRPHADAGGVSSLSEAERRRQGIWLVVLYGMPGFGYIITATFLPVIARHALPGSNWPDLFWPMFGAALIPGSLFAARLPARWDNRLLLAACYVVQAVGIALGIVFPTAAGFAIGSVLIGLPFTAITLFAMREARRLRGEHAAGLMGYATAAYGVGQIVGPLVAAPIAARVGSFAPSLWLAALVLMAGAAGLVVLASKSR